MAPADAPASPLLPKFLTIGFVGKRKLPQGDAALRTTLARVLDELETEFPGPGYVLVGLSSLAMGADLVFAELIAQRHVAALRSTGRPSYAQQIFLPSQEAGFFLPDDFRLSETEPETTVRQRLTQARACLHTQAVLEVRITGVDPDRNERFAETAYEIVSECDVLLVACTQAEKEAVLGSASAVDFARGGSAETLQHAYATGKRLLVIEVDAPVGVDNVLPITPKLAPRLENQPLKATRAELGFEHLPSPPMVPLAELQYPKVLAQIHAEADKRAVHTKTRFVWYSEWVLGGHLLATFVAALALAFGLGGASALLAGIIKFSLLLLVLLLAWRLHHRTEQREWLEARLLAELTRAALNLLSTVPATTATPQPPLYPGGPRHLREFHLPELSSLAKSLYMLHLREFCVRVGKNHYDYGAHTSTTAKEMALRYVSQRLDAPKQAGGQIKYFEQARDLAKHRLHRMERWFFLFSIAATFCAFGALLFALPMAGIVPDINHTWYYKLLFKFLPLTLPVAAASLIAWISLRDLDREAERYADMLDYLKDAREELLESNTTAQLRRRIDRLEMALLQELVEWRAKIKATHAG